MEKTVIITDIQRYCIHDGDGIRTTVFFKGCPLQCMWCHNPETQDGRVQLMDQPEKCTGCGGCMDACTEGAVRIEGYIAVTDRDRCKCCGECTEICTANLRELSGRRHTVAQLFREIRKDEMFYEESGGGVTLSGGEVMAADISFVEELVKKLHRFGISITIDTCGMAPWENFERIYPYIDTFLYDIKLIDEQLHRKYTGCSNELILSNLIKLSKTGARIYIRIPTVLEVNGNDTEMAKIATFLKDNNIRPDKICLLPYHNTGNAKYQRLGEGHKDIDFHKPSDAEMQSFVTLFKDAGYANVQIGG